MAVSRVVSQLNKIKSLLEAVGNYVPLKLKSNF